MAHFEACMQSSTSVRQRQKHVGFCEKYGSCTIDQSKRNYPVSKTGRDALVKLNFTIIEQLGMASSWPKVKRDLLLYGSSAFTSNGLDVEIWV